MRRMWAAIMVLSPSLLAALVAVPSDAQTQSPPITIKLATGAQEHLSVGKGFGKFAQLVNEHAKGRVNIEVYYGGALGYEGPAIRNMLAGTVEMATISDGNLAAFSDALTFMTLPYMFDGTRGLRKVIDTPSVREKINQGLAKTNMRALLHFDNGGPRHMLSNKGPIRVPADLKGQKIRATNSPVEIAIIRAFGALPTTVSGLEVYTALSQGILDGEGIMLTWAVTLRDYEAVKYMCENGYVIGTHNGLIRLDFWNRLPSDIQNIMLEAAKDAEEWEAKVDADFTREAREKIIASGVHVYTPTSDELKQWKEAVVPKVWDMFKDKVSPQFIQMIEDLQKKR